MRPSYTPNSHFTLDTAEFRSQISQRTGKLTNLTTQTNQYRKPTIRQSENFSLTPSPFQVDVQRISFILQRMRVDLNSQAVWMNT